MGTVKTAISIDSGIYKKVQKLARRLHISRSRFFSQSAQYMINKSSNLELLNKINAVFRDDPAETQRQAHEKKYHGKVVESW